MAIILAQSSFATHLSLLYTDKSSIHTLAGRVALLMHCGLPHTASDDVVWIRDVANATIVRHTRTGAT